MSGSQSGDGRREPGRGRDDTGFEIGPPAPGLPATLVPAAVAVVAAGVVLTAGVVAAVGTVAMGVGVSRGSRWIHTTGAGLAFGGVLLAGARGAPSVLVVVGAAAALLAWDAGEHAVGLAHQVGADADARRNLLVHVGATATAACGIALLAGGVYLLAAAGRSGAAAGVLAVAGGLLALLIDR